MDGSGSIGLKPPFDSPRTCGQHGGQPICSGNGVVSSLTDRCNRVWHLIDEVAHVRLRAGVEKGHGTARVYARLLVV